jgi:hypothetical protein
VGGRREGGRKKEEVSPRSKRRKNRREKGEGRVGGRREEGEGVGRGRWRREGRKLIPSGGGRREELAGLTPFSEGEAICSGTRNRQNLDTPHSPLQGPRGGGYPFWVIREHKQAATH